MTHTLGIHFGAAGITAARFDSFGDEPIEVVPLGESGPAAVSAVAQSEDGAVLVGDAAMRADGPRVVDPLERAAGGRVGALVAVLGHVIGRATTAAGRAPVRLAIVVPDDWDADARERIVVAGATAGIADTITVLRGTAAAHPIAVENEAVIAAGAARVGSAVATPLVTREDLGDRIEAKGAVVPPPTEPPWDPVSVFDPEEPSEPEPPRPVPAAPPPAHPPTQALPPVIPVVEPLRYEAPERRVGAGVVFAVVLVALIAAVGGALAFSGGDDSPLAADAESTTTTVPTTTAGVSTTVASTTTESVTNTTEDPDTTSTSTSSTSTSSTSSTTTTTTPVAVGTPGPVTLVETGLQFDTGGVVRFGQDIDVVLEEVVGILGEADEDVGWEEHAFCAGPRTRFVRFGELELVFTEDGAQGEEPLETGTFSQWHASGHEDPTGLVTRDGLGVGATVGFLDVTYGSALVIVAALEGEDLALFAVTNPGSGGVLNGTTSDLTPEGQVLDLWSGDSCTRIFT